MRLTLVLIIIGLTLVLSKLYKYNDEKLITKESIEELKSKATFKVIDYENHPFKDLTKSEIIKKLGSMKPLNTIHTEIVYGTPSGLPAAFNYAQKWPQCNHPIRDQQSCGSCWAFAASEVLSDRFCIATNGSTNIVLSPQDLVSCDKEFDLGCNGGYVDKSWDYIRDTGIVSDECLPYTSGNGKTGRCEISALKFTCKIGVYRKYRVSGHQQYVTVEDAKNTLFTEGPIEARFDVYSDFMSYAGGVYKRISNNLLGGHAVKVVGWGTDADGSEYWVAANSWNTIWGELGFFRIALGQCGFEDSLWAGIPLI